MGDNRRPSLSILPASVALIIANAIAIAVFMAGFLLVRIELPNFSQCSEPPASEAFMREFAIRHDYSSHYQLMLDKWENAGRPYLEGTQTTASGCWTSRRFRKAVLVIIDAMRFDFAHNDENEPETAANANFKNHLRLFEQLQHSHPENCKLFVFEADPPTTTMQRLKGIVTGVMPTFIDFSSNFDSSAITEDNIMLQLEKIGLDAVMMGDDTWLNLFPHTFRRAFPYPSFNVKDLHTVDDGVIAHLRPEIDAGNFDLLIAHFLGVDHVGHRFHANHPSMKDKLKQLNGVLDDLVAAIDDTTILFVFGDHGMTAEGNHGGTTKQETNAALFTYSKQKLFHRSELAHDHPQIKQVDLVPTLSLLLGSSIPYSSLGTVMTELFTANSTAPWKNACGALRINAWQVQRYLHDYSARSGAFESELMQHSTEEFLDVDHDFIQLSIHLQSEMVDAESLYKDLAQRYERVLSKAQAMCREKWTMFDMTYMTYGIILLVVGLIGIGANTGLEPIVALRSHFKSVLISTVTLAPLVYCCSGVPAAVSVSIAVSAGLLLHIFSSSLRTPRRALSLPHPTVFVAIAVLIAYLAGLFSNSIIIIESSVVHYFAASFCLLLGLYDLRFASADAPRIALVTFLTFVSLRLMGHGASYGPGAILSDEFFSFGQLLRTYGSLIVLAAVSHWYSRSIRHRFLSLYFTAWLLFCFCIISVYWYLDATVMLDQHQPWHFLPQLVYGASFLLLLLVFLFRFSIGRQHSLNLLLASIAAPYMLLLGPKSPFVFGLTLAIIYLRQYRLQCLNTFVHSGFPECMFFWILGLRLYFATGHSNTFNSLQVSSAFVGFEHFNYYRSGFLLLVNTFGGYIVCALGLAIISLDYTKKQLAPLHQSDSRGHGYAFDRPAMVIVNLHLFRSGFSTLNVLLNRRHLMVWDIFVPKFVLDIASLAAVVIIMFSIVVINKAL